MSVELEVDEDEAGTRLDVLLVRRVDGLSRSRAKRMIGDGQARVNGRRAKKGHRLAPGDQVRLASLPPPVEFVPLPSSGDLEVAYEDEALVIVNKPAGMPTHPLRPDERDTLANLLIARYPEMKGVGYALREPGLLHRLDNDTSGLVLAARDTGTFESLRDTLKSGAIDKRYEVLADGRIETTRVIDAPIATHPSDPRRVHVCLDPDDRRMPSARRARTELLELRPVGANFTYALVVAAVAVRHQIRAHFSALGHPLVGDLLYGGSSPELQRHFLHASELAFLHPRSGELLRVSSPLPTELATFLTGAS